MPRRRQDGLSRYERREEKFGKTCGLLTVVSLLPFIAFDEMPRYFFHWH